MRSRSGSYDNALAESVIGLFKMQLIWRRGPWRGRGHVEFATLEWVSGGSTIIASSSHSATAPPTEFEENSYRDHAGQTALVALT